MIYDLHREGRDGAIISVETIEAAHVSEAYDHCVAQVASDVDTAAIHLHVGQTLIHTVRAP